MKKARIKLSVSQKIILVSSFIALLTVQYFCLRSYKTVKKQQQISSAKTFGENIASNVQLVLEEGVLISDYVKNLYVKYHENFLKDFDYICEDFTFDKSMIKSVAIAPNGVIEAIYPADDSDLGVNLLNDSDISSYYEAAINARTVTIAGPYELKRGGVGLVIRNPVYENGVFSAFSIVIIDWDRFIREILRRVPKENSDYNFGIWNIGSDNAVIRTDDSFLYKSVDGNLAKTVNVKIRIPNDVWYLSVEPKSGWKDYSNMLLEMILSSLAIFVVFLGILLRQHSNSKNLYNAQHDDLTDVLSRTTFLQYVEKLLSVFPNDKVAIVAADIENFKYTNSIYGTEMGDKILKYLASYFMEISPFELCTRFGSDHFIFVIRKESVEGNMRYLELLAQDIAANAPIENLVVKYGYYGEIKGDIPINLICDKALLAAKSILHKYEKTVADYNGPLSIKNEKSQMYESSFLKSLKNEDFKIWFQPKFNSITNEIIGAEALVRWIKSDGTFISPADFIPVFEKDGLIYNLDLYVFETVCKQIKYWLDQGCKILPISVNISRNTLQRKNSIREYARIREEFGIPPEYIPLEITESSTSKNKDIQKLAEDLRATGFKIHLDDFGSGLSSLESLNLLPFDVIKLDKSLIDFIGTPTGEELLRHIVELIQFMGMNIIAEGVEEKAQLEFLKKLNCNHIQGFLYSPPMSYEDFIQYLREYYKK